MSVSLIMPCIRAEKHIRREEKWERAAPLSHVLQTDFMLPAQIVLNICPVINNTPVSAIKCLSSTGMLKNSWHSGSQIKEAASHFFSFYCSAVDPPEIVICWAGGENKSLKLATMCWKDQQQQLPKTPPGKRLPCGGVNSLALVNSQVCMFVCVRESPPPKLQHPSR